MDVREPATQALRNCLKLCLHYKHSAKYSFRWEIGDKIFEQRKHIKVETIAYILLCTKVITINSIDCKHLAFEYVNIIFHFGKLT